MYKCETYIFPPARNIRGVIHDGEQSSWIERPFDVIVAYWKEWWAIPRAGRTSRWLEFDKNALFRTASQAINMYEHESR